MKIQAYLGDICEVSAAVVCVSTNPYLELMAGTGGAVRDRGGWSIQEECIALMVRHCKVTRKKYFDPGSAELVRAGKLPFRGVVLCVAIDPFHDSSEEIIAQCVKNTLLKIQLMDPPIQSIAFPVLASGHAGFDFEKSLRVMLKTIQQSATSKLEDIFIVTLDETKLSRIKRFLTE